MTYIVSGGALNSTHSLTHSRHVRMTVITINAGTMGRAAWATAGTGNWI